MNNSNKISQCPLVSVIIPTYNRAFIISETLKSVAKQTYNNWECIIVDDYSLDNTTEVVQSFCARDSRFKLFKNNRIKGAPGARNTGMKVCLGEYVIFLDSDDLLLPHCLLNRVECVVQSPQIDLLICLQKRFENGIEKNYVNVPSEHHPLVRFFCPDPVSDVPWVCNSTLIRKRFITDNQIWWDENIKLHQDIQFNLALLINNPYTYWSLKEFDCYWTFYDNVKNIGSDVEELYEKKFKMFHVYYSALICITNHDIKHEVNRQYHALVVWFVLHYIHRIDIDINPLFLFLKSKTDLGRKNILILKLIRRIYRLRASFYLKQKILSSLKSYLAKQFPSIIKSPNFLKVSKLPDNLNEDLFVKSKGDYRLAAM